MEIKCYDEAIQEYNSQKIIICGLNRILRFFVNITFTFKKIKMYQIITFVIMSQ